MKCQEDDGGPINGGSELHRSSLWGHEHNGFAITIWVSHDIQVTRLALQ